MFCIGKWLYTSGVWFICSREVSGPTYGYLSGFFFALFCLPYCFVLNIEGVLSLASPHCFRPRILSLSVWVNKNKITLTTSTFKSTFNVGKKSWDITQTFLEFQTFTDQLSIFFRVSFQKSHQLILCCLLVCFSIDSVVVPGFYVEKS